MRELFKRTRSILRRVDASGTSAQIAADVLRAQTSSRASAAASAASPIPPESEGVRASLAAHLIAAVQAKPKAVAVATAKATAVAPAKEAPNPLAERIREREAKRANLRTASSPGAQAAAASATATPSSPLLRMASQAPSMGVAAQTVAASLHDAAIRSGLIEAPPPALRAEAPPPAILKQSLLSPEEHAARESKHLTDLTHDLNTQEFSSAGDTPYVDPKFFKYENGRKAAQIAANVAAGKPLRGFATTHDLTGLSSGKETGSFLQTDGAHWVEGYESPAKPGENPTHVIGMSLSSLNARPVLPNGQKPPHNPQPRAEEYTEYGEGGAMQAIVEVRADGVTINPLPTAPAVQAELKAAQTAVQQVSHTNSQELSSAGDTPYRTHNAAGVSSAQAAFFSHARPTAASAPIASTADQPKPPDSGDGLHQ